MESDPKPCPWCAGGSRRSEWGPYCSGGCEYSAELAQARAEGAAAEQAKIAAEIAAWRKACEEAYKWGDDMRVCMLAALMGTDRTGRNAAMERILREWALEQINAVAGATNYIELKLDYTESTPGLVVLVHIQRERGETPGNRATRLQAERDAATARAEAAEQRAEALEREVAQARAEGAAAERARIAAEIAALATEPDHGGLVLTPRLSPATAAALRDVARRVASGDRD